MSHSVVQHIVLCEGFDDRAFWKGWLEHLGCVSKGPGSRDPWKREVRKGEFAFETPGGCFLRLVPVGGDGNLAAKVRFFLGEHNHPVGALVVSWDRDDSPKESSLESDRKRLEGMLGDCEVQGAWCLTPSGIRAAAVTWHFPLAALRPGVPQKNTLEGLVAAAITSVHQDRGVSVESWLNAAPSPGELTHKNYAYAYLAKWYAKYGCTAFYEKVWRDEAVRQALKAILGSSCGAVEEMTQATS